MFYIYAIVVVMTVILYFYPYIKRFLKIRESINKIPGPKTYPIIGNLLETANLKKEGEIVSW